jgi:hypothetical protein
MIQMLKPISTVLFAMSVVFTVLSILSTSVMAQFLPASPIAVCAKVRTQNGNYKCPSYTTCPASKPLCTLNTTNVCKCK